MLKRVIGIGGEPATGKSTLVRALLDDVGNVSTFKYRLVRGYTKSNLFIVGIYGDKKFGGTDALSMAVQPDFIMFLDMLSRNPSHDATVIFEGDRLFNLKCISHVSALYPCTFLCLSAKGETLDIRHRERNDTQSDKFLKSRRTKYANILNSDYPVHLRHNETDADCAGLVAEIKGFMTK